jgi:hypothetical protein
MIQRTGRRRFLAVCSGLALTRFGNAADRASSDHPSVPLNRHDAINVREHGATGDGHTDDTYAIESAARLAKLKKKALYLPTGTYAHGGLLNLDSIVVFGDGNSTVILSTDGGQSRPQHALVLSGANVELHSVAVKTQWTGVRQANYAACGILLSEAKYFRVCNVSVTGSACAGIAAKMSTNGLISACKVSKTSADGISFVNGSSRNIAENNEIIDSGDDSISVVSYVSDSMCENLVISKNRITHSLARGIAVAGGVDVLITENQIRNATNAGVQICTDGSHKTRGASRIQAIGNLIDSCGSEQPYYGAVNIVGVPEWPASDILIKDNLIENSNNNCIQLGAGGGVFVKNISIINNVINKSTNNKDGIFIAGAADVLIEQNKISGVNLSIYSSDGGGVLSILNNKIDDVRLRAGSNEDLILIKGKWQRVDIRANIPGNMKARVLSG